MKKEGCNRYIETERQESEKTNTSNVVVAASKESESFNLRHAKQEDGCHQNEFLDSKSANRE